MNASRTPRLARARGYTMIELMGVVIIAGIAAAVILPQLSDDSEYQVDAAGRMLLADLTYAHNYAIATQQYTYVTFPVNTQYELCNSVYPSVTTLTSPITHEAYTIVLAQGSASALSMVKFSSWTVSSHSYPTIAFNEIGEPYACDSSGNLTSLTSGATINVISTENNYQRTITVQPNTGEMSIQ